MEQILKKIIQELCEKLELKITEIEITKEENERYHVNMKTDEPTTMIGASGETIRAIQHLAKILFWKQTRAETHIFLDIDDYRKRQENSVKAVAQRKAELARSTQQPQSLLPMSSYFRRIVHLHLAQPEFADLMTESVGEDDRRKVVIKLKENTNGEK